MKRALMIVNPAAGQQGPLAVAELARRRLVESGWEVRVEATGAGGHAERLAARHRHECERVVVVGGDGTLRETLLGVGANGPPVGLVPIGKANVVARELRIPRHPADAIDALGRLEPRTLDLGTVQDTIFLAMVGVGYDARVTEGVRRLRESRGGGFLYNRGGSGAIYAAAGLPPLLQSIAPALTVHVDGVASGRIYRQAVIANTETYATGWAMTPGADPTDGVLDHQLNRRSAPWFVLLTLGASALRWRLPALVADYGRGQAYTIEGSRPFAWQIDGDSMPRTDRLTIGIRSGGARLLVPTPVS